MGFVGRPVPLGHPDFGRAFPCQCVLNEGKERRLQRLLSYSNLGPLERLTFDNLAPQGRSADPSAREAFARAVAAARAFAQEPAGWLVFTGPSGCGKTHLAAAAANLCLREGYPVLFMVVPDLLDHLRAAYKPDSEMPYDDLFYQVKSAPILVLDDLGTHSATPWAQEKLFQILNYRYNAKLPTIVTVGKHLGELDDRVRTRLEDPELAHLFSLGGAPAGKGIMGGLSLPILKEMTFQGFDTQGLGLDERASRNLKEALRVAKTYAESPEGWKVFLGATGCGKTHLAVAIGHFWQDRGLPVEFCVVPDLLDFLRATFRPEAPEGPFPELFEKVRTAPYLILDDLGTHSATPWAQEKLFQILNYRYNAKLPTVITVGRPLEELPEAWVSRMCYPKVSDIFEVEAPDYRGLPRRPRAQARRRS